MTIVYHDKVVQGSEEWHQLRCGILTASKLSKLLTPTLKVASNDDSRAIIFELVVERLTGRVSDDFQSWDMRRGNEEEIYARMLYSQKYYPVQEMGFITNDKLGFPIGYSPDGLVGDDGSIECKSRSNKLQIKTVLAGVIPSEHVIQVQSGLFVSERKWQDYNSYSNGLVMWTTRAEPIPEYQEAIAEAAKSCEAAVTERMAEWEEILKSKARIQPTEYRDYNEEISPS